MRHSLAAALLIAILAAPPADAQGRPDFSGQWAFVADAQPGAKPAPGYGPQITIWHDGDSFTVTRMFGGRSVPVGHTLDGAETRARVPGGLCQGDSRSVWAAEWQGSAVVTTMRGTIAPGAESVTKRDLRATFSMPAADMLTLQVTIPATAGAAASVASATYKKAGPPPARPAPEPASALTVRLSQLEWLGGTWIGTSDTSTFEERWTPPAGGSMLGVARSLRGGAMSSFEFLCIVERNGGLVYTAMPNGRQPATDFALTKIDGQTVTFENPAHDFPKMIRYSVLDDGTLQAVVGGAEGRKPQVFTLRKQ